MRSKIVFVLLLGIIFAMSCWEIFSRIAYAEDSESARENVKQQILSIGRSIEEEDRRIPFYDGSNVFVVGNIYQGYVSWSRGCSKKESLDKAFNGCEKYGSGCEQLFCISVKNDTDKEAKVYLYTPNETNPHSKNALWEWILSSGQESVLSIKGSKLLLPTSMLIMAKYSTEKEADVAESSEDRCVKKINEYAHSISYSSNNWNVRIHLAPQKDE